MALYVGRKSGPCLLDMAQIGLFCASCNELTQIIFDYVLFNFVIKHWYYVQFAHYVVTRRLFIPQLSTCLHHDNMTIHNIKSHENQRESAIEVIYLHYNEDTRISLKK